MMRILLLLLLLFSAAYASYAQQLPGECPPNSINLSNTCGGACVLCDFTTFTSNNNNPAAGQQVPPNFCPGQMIFPHNVQWVGFVAGSTSITMNLSVFNCALSGNNGLQAGIWGTTNCQNFTLVSNCLYQAPPNQTSVLTATNLTIGGTYFLVVDGFNDDVCDFTANVTSGSTVVGAVAAPPAINAPPQPYCPGGNYSFTANAPNAGAYNWTLNGVPIGTDPNANISFPANGTYTLCVSGSNVCNGEGPQNCTTFTVGNLAPVQDPPVNICEGQSYTVNGFAFNTPGMKEYTITTPQGCTQTRRFTLNVNPNKMTNLEDNICIGESVVVGGQVFTTTGQHTVNLQTTQGCDSTVTLNLTAHPPSLTIIPNVQICSTDGGYTIGGQTFTTTGTHQVTIPSFFGCDSTIVVVLEVFTPTAVTIFDTICQGEFYQLGFTFYNTTGVYQQAVTGPGGCINQTTLFLTVSAPRDTLNQVVCNGQSFSVGNSTYSSTGTFTTVLPGASSLGCDSTVVLNLNVLPPITTTLNQTICANESFSVANNSYNTAGTYVNVIQAANGCDSTVTLNLAVNPTPVTNLDVTICAEDTYTVGNTAYDISGTYQQILNSALGCDSTVNLNLTVLPPIVTDLLISICDGDSYSVGSSTYSDAGNYTNVLTAANGCDSTVNLALNVLPIPQTTLNVSVCEGQSYQVGSSTYTLPGVYSDVLVAATGCDSVVTLNLNVIVPLETYLNIEICTGQTYTLGSNTYTDPGNYSELFQAASGCDSIVYLNLGVLDILIDTLGISICNGESFTVGNSTYSATGVYEDFFITSEGCDSLVVLNLDVLPTPETALQISICNGESFSAGNSTYSATGIFTDVLVAANGCDSTVTLNLTVLPTPQTTLNISICNGESFSVGSSTYDASGTYTDVLTAANGCDSTVTLNLTVLPTPATALDITICNGESFSVGSSTYSSPGTFVDVLSAANGCDSTITLNLTVLPTPATALSIAICDGESFSVGASTYTSSGTFMDVLPAANGCDSTVTLNLLVNPIPVTNIITSICEGASITVGTSVYTTDGIYQDVLVAATGCDSIVNLNLTISDFYETNLTRAICEGESFSVGNSVYTTTGNFQDFFQAQDGCDSIVNLALTVHPIPVTGLSPVICEGESFSAGSSTYTASGVYQDVLTAITGCDSIVNVNLTVNPVFSTSLTEAVCQGESFTVGNSVYNTSGVFTDMLIASNGCDSTVTLNLTVNPIPVTDLVQTVCAGETFAVGSSTYNTSGVFQDVLIAVTGCDSIINLDLTVRAPFTTALTRAICQGESFGVGSSVYTASGVFTDVLTSVTGCDSTITLNLTVNPVYEVFLDELICNDETLTVGNNSFSATGTYQVVLSSIAGCDSIVNLNLTTYPCALAFTSSSGAASCFGVSDGSVQFIMTVGTPPYSYEWAAVGGTLTGNGTLVANNTPVQIPGLPAGNYRIVVTDFYGVVQIINVNVAQPTPVVVSLSGSNYNGYGVSCPGESDGEVTVTVSGGNAPYTYLWNTGATQPFLRDVPSGTYTLTLRDANGCLSAPAQPSITLTAPPEMVISLSATDPPCFGQTQGSISIDGVQGGTGPYLYALEGRAFSSLSIFGGLDIGAYTIQVQDANGCVQTTIATVNQPPQLIVGLGLDLSIKLGDSARLEAITSYPVETYAWNGGEGLSCYDCPNPMAAPFYTSNYAVTVADRNGCTASDQITVFVDRRRNVFFPTAFSPNDDGINDRFYPQSANNVSVVRSFLVFNRWGEPIFELYNFQPNDPAYGWDGSHRSKMLNPGVYVYVAEVEFIDGDVVIYKGDVTLIR